MITLGNLIKQTNFNDVMNCITSHYETRKHDSFENFKNLYDKLTKIIPVKNSTNMFIYINAFKEDEDGEYYRVRDFNEDDTNVFFDVSGKDNEHYGYSLAACSFEEWIGYCIDKETLENFSYKNIIAHCIWEMTFYGFKRRKDEDGVLIFNRGS